jgi:putative transposase
VAISNHRLVEFTNGQVGFRWKDYAHGNKRRLMTIAAEEFLRRFLLHTLPRGFVRIRFFGFLANRRRATSLASCRQLLKTDPRLCSTPQATAEPRARAGWTCPLCGGPMAITERLTAQQISAESVGRATFVDTS